MAPDSDVPTSADKGKGKAVEKSKEEKDQPVLNGKKDDNDKKDGMELEATVHLVPWLTLIQLLKRSSTRRTSSSRMSLT